MGLTATILGATWDCVLRNMDLQRVLKAFEMLYSDPFGFGKFMNRVMREISQMMSHAISRFAWASLRSQTGKLGLSFFTASRPFPPKPLCRSVPSAMHLTLGAELSCHVFTDQCRPVVDICHLRDFPNATASAHRKTANQ